jgi:hypothetical protein
MEESLPAILSVLAAVLVTIMAVWARRAHRRVGLGPAPRWHWRDLLGLSGAMVAGSALLAAGGLWQYWRRHAELDAPGRQVAFELLNWPYGWGAVFGAFALVSLCMVVVWLYRRELRAEAQLPIRCALAGLRVVVLLGLAAVLLGPALVAYDSRRIDAYTLVLLDDSASMAIEDRYRDAADADRVRAALSPAVPDLPITRLELVRRLLQSPMDDRLLRLSQRGNRVKVFGFADDCRLLATIPPLSEEGQHPLLPTPLTSPAGESTQSDAAAPLDHTPRPSNPPLHESEVLQLTGSGARTDLGQAVRTALGSLAGAPAAAIVVISDGGFNHGPPAEVVGEYARGHGVPVLALGVGDPAVPRNVRLTELIAPRSAFKKDPISVTVRLAATGLEGQTLEVELRRGTAGQGEPVEVVASERVTVGPQGDCPPVVFRYAVDEPGEYRFLVNVPLQEGETIAEDNARPFELQVLDDQLRVLVISGSPTWQYRYLVRLLERDATVNVSEWLQSADAAAVRSGDTVITELPTGREALMEYDAVVLMDPDPQPLDRDWQQTMETLVAEHGKGLMFAVGRKYTPRLMRDSANETLLKLLPIVVDAEADLLINQQGNFPPRPWPILIEPTAWDHPILSQQTDAAQTQQIWSELPGAYWFYPVRTSKPVATVLMRHSDPRYRNQYGAPVLMACQYYGSGRTAYLGFDSTWRWRQVGEQYFQRFWIQTLRFLAEGKLLGQTRRGLLLTEKDAYTLGETVGISARLLGPDYHPLEADTVAVQLRLADQPPKTVNLSAQPNRPGWFAGRWAPSEAGLYSLSIELPELQGGRAQTVQRDVRVEKPNVEVIAPQLHVAALQTLAVASGGEYFDVDGIDELIGRVEDRHEVLTVAAPPIELWDTPSLLLGLVVLLGVEWAIRKRLRLL